MSTYTPIASVTLTSAQASVTFSGIPQTYTDLVAVIEGTATTSLGTIQMRFNGDTGTNYSSTYMWGTGSAAVSDRDSNITTGGCNIGFLGTGRGNNIINIQSYSNTTTNKTAIVRSSVPGNRVAATVNLWRSTAAVNEVRFNILGGDTFTSGSTFNLYGVANASITNTAKATGGDSVTTDGTYWYHTFRTSGTFTPTQALTADCLVIAGGGGATGFDSGGGGGGGGAGGLCQQNSRSMNLNQGYTVTIGAGGAGVSTGARNNGSNTVFDTITALGGGGGGIATNDSSGDPSSGGSGGGGGGYFAGNIVGASATQGNSGGATGYGNAGGNGVLNQFTTGGGGGAGAVGQNGNSNVKSGNGGDGLNTWSTWATATLTGVSGYYAGGGGGGARVDQTPTPGTGGAGGGGDGKTSGNGGNGVANTGSGGGGARAATGGAGGSGIVIVRYSV